MEPKERNEDGMDAADTDEGVSFSDVSTVVTRWTMDFLFASLCRRFKEGQLEEFDQTLTTLESMSQNPSLRGGDLDKVRIVAFFTRVMHGKQIDVQYEEDSSVMPLMSAAKLWLGLKSTVADEKTFEDITILLLVQAVAVCLEKGDSTLAWSVVRWLEEERQFPEGLSVKLTTVVRKHDTYHPLLKSFSYSRLLESVQGYIDAYLQRNPCDYLIKAATDMLKSQENEEALERSTQQNSCLSDPSNIPTKKTKTKYKLLSTTVHDFFGHGSQLHKKSYVPLRRITLNELSQTNTVRKPPVETSKKDSSCKKTQRKKPQKWTPELDRCLKRGVSEHGVGKWARILMDYDFKGRTGTMLKDRWRTLTKEDSTH